MSRIDIRHNRSKECEEDVKQACLQEPALYTDLQALFSDVCRSALSETCGDPATRELVGSMERIAATALHSALIECWSAAGTNIEDCHLWAEGIPTSTLSVPAYMPDVSGQSNHEWGKLEVSPPYLLWKSDYIPLSSTTTTPNGVHCSACVQEEPLEISWHLASFAGVNDDADEHALCQLRLLQGEDDGLLFGFKSVGDLMLFERTLRVAASSARAVIPTDTATPASAHRLTSSTAIASTSANTIAPPAKTVDAIEKNKRQKNTEEPRVRKGRELRDALSKVAKLYSHDKTAQARAAFESIPPGTMTGNRSILGRAEELRTLLFTFGGLNLTRAVLDKFLSMPEVKRLLDKDYTKSREDLTDAKTATAMLQAAKRCLNVMHERAAGGRRTDAERNAFWASVVSLMPADLLENRQGRAMMRILGISYKTMKTANVYRKQLEDSGKAWVLLTTKRHFDNIEVHWEIFDEWIHSEEASTPDNAHKEQIRVYNGYGIDPQTGRRGYALHWRRAQEGNNKELLAKWHESAAAAKFKLATTTHKRPYGVQIGRKQLVKWRCPCVKLRTATFADCKICSFVEESIKLWHKKRFGWRKEFLKRNPDHASTCHICSNEELARAYHLMSRSPHDLWHVLLPCGQTEHPGYSMEGSGTGNFKAFNLLCCRNRCAKKKFASVAGTNATQIAPLP